jgi:hypothetical protein
MRCNFTRTSVTSIPATPRSVTRAVAFIWGAPWRQRGVLRVFRTLQRAALAIGLAIVPLFFVFPDALFARLAIYSETLTPRGSASELQTRTWDYPLRNFWAPSTTIAPLAFST